MIRLFAGLALPESITERLALLAGGVPGARWVAPENMHVTLKFIGNVENGLAEDVAAALETVSCPAFEIALDGAGFFGKSHAARQLWVGVAGGETLVRLQRKVEKVLEGVGIAREERKFTPHVTLARLKRAPADRVEGFAAEHAGFRAGPVPVDAFTLFSSYLSHSGAVYTPEVVYPLGA
jgi:2'-5' RNA ligase